MSSSHFSIVKLFQLIAFSGEHLKICNLARYIFKTTEYQLKPLASYLF